MNNKLWLKLDEVLAIYNTNSSEIIKEITLGKLKANIVDDMVYFNKDELKFLFVEFDISYHILNKKIEDFSNDFNLLLKNRIDKANFIFIKDIVKYTREELLTLGHFGELSISLLESFLLEHNLQLKKSENSISIDPKPKFQSRSKERLISMIEHYFEIVKNNSELYFKEEQTNFKNEFGFEDEHKEVWRIFGRSFGGFYPLTIAEEYLNLIKEKDVEEATNEIINIIHSQNK